VAPIFVVRVSISVPIREHPCWTQSAAPAACAPSSLLWDEVVRPLDASGKKWVIVTDLAGEPAFISMCWRRARRSNESGRGTKITKSAGNFGMERISGDMKGISP